MGSGLRLTNLAEKRFGKLQVISLEKTRQHGHAVWRCFCDCGGTTRVRADRLTTGHTTSCGCHKKLTYKACVLTSRNQRWRSHPRMRYTQMAEYWAYRNAISRCENPRHQEYHLYGGRGILCRFTSFREFFRHLGPRPSRKYSLDRIDSDGDYEPTNCRWATAKEQRANQRGSSPYQEKRIVHVGADDPETLVLEPEPALTLEERLKNHAAMVPWLQEQRGKRRCRLETAVPTATADDRESVLSLSKAPAEDPCRQRERLIAAVESASCWPNVKRVGVPSRLTDHPGTALSREENSTCGGR